MVNGQTNSQQPEACQGGELHIEVHISNPKSWEALDRLVEKFENACEFQDHIGGDENGNIIVPLLSTEDRVRLRKNRHIKRHYRRHSSHMS